MYNVDSSFTPDPPIVSDVSRLRARTLVSYSLGPPAEEASLLLEHSNIRFASRVPFWAGKLFSFGSCGHPIYDVKNQQAADASSYPRPQWGAPTPPSSADGPLHPSFTYGSCSPHNQSLSWDRLSCETVRCVLVRCPLSLARHHPGVNLSQTSAQRPGGITS